jgi:Putative multicopper oxidases
VRTASPGYRRPGGGSGGGLVTRAFPRPRRPHRPWGNRPDAHGEGIRLDAAEPAAPAPGSGCDGRAPARAYDVAAVAVDITLNRYLDHDPRGRMYVLEEDLARVRDEESRNATARAGGGEPAVSVGLQGDAVQPLVLRVTPGECLRIRFRNGLPGDEAASVNVHGAPLRVAGTGAPAIGSEPGALATPGQAVTYEWQVADDEPEGTRYFHSHAPREREQAVHGLFGAVIVEPKGSTWSDPRTGGPVRAGWDAMVSPPTRPAFREHAILYHEVGDETYQVLDRTGAFVPLVDPLTHAYRPGSRAMNYRSEPFLNRLSLQKRVTGVVDESLAYSSYAFGDPATPILRSYLGDPATQRVVHAGSEVFHVHHVHGGAIRWPRSPGCNR